MSEMIVENFGYDDDDDDDAHESIHDYEDLVLIAVELALNYSIRYWVCPISINNK